MTPKSFKPDTPSSFVSDDSREMQVVESTIDQTISKVSLDALPPLVREALINIGTRTEKPSVLLAPFKRMGTESRVKTYQSETDEITSLVGQMKASALAFVTAVENHHLPEKVKRQHQMEVVTHETTMLNLAEAAVKAKLSLEMINRAKQEGLPLEIYLQRLIHAEAHEQKKKDLELSLKEKEELNRIQRENLKQEALEHIEVLTFGEQAYLRRRSELRKERKKLIIQIDEYKLNTSMSDYRRGQLIQECEDELSELGDELARLKEKFGEIDTEKDV